jgi:hypothetical protein
VYTANVKELIHGISAQIALTGLRVIMTNNTQNRQPENSAMNANQKRQITILGNYFPCSVLSKKQNDILSPAKYNASREVE